MGIKPFSIIAGLTLLLVGCSSSTTEGDSKLATGGSDEPASSGGANAGGGSDVSGTGGGLTTGGSGGLLGSTGGTVAPLDACTEAGLSCGSGQRCDDSGDEPACADNTCSDLSCTQDEDCRAAEDGPGHVCVSAACVRHVDCDDGEYCDGSACRLDACVALARTCNGDDVLSCDNVGGGEAALFTCASGGYFTSACVDDAAGAASCTCEGDWDCPTFTVCEVGQCVGTGEAPTCTLPAVDFASVPPALELHWGGDAPSDTAHDGTLPSEMAPDAPWAAFTHVLNTPIVANLDDDNGDGLINELDFPEILFSAHKGNNPWGNAVVRAIHGGGPHKGKDYFARCGDLLWTEMSPITDVCADSAPSADAGAPVAVGDLDGDGVPEIVVPLENNRFQILDNTGALIYTLPQAWVPNSGSGETIAIANLDHTGYAELIVGPHVFVLGDDATSGALVVTHILTGNKSVGSNEISFMACPADLDETRPGLEVAVGTTLYALPTSLDACATPPCSGALDVVWHAPAIGTQGDQLNSGDKTDEGFCAVADVWGADAMAAPGPNNPKDGKAEVVLISNGRLIILDGATGTLIDIRNLGGGSRGGAPNVDDFDGDGFMEVASALENFYTVVDLQEPDTTYCPAWNDTLPRDPAGANTNPARTPGAGTDGLGACASDADCQADVAVCGSAGVCVCLHNGWRRGSDDSSSRATSSSVFDFNGDGSAEVIYNDECELRVYRGDDGSVLYNEASRSRTGIENPVVADVDNDGNAEIVVGSNNAVGNRCDEDGSTPTGVNGLRVFGDPTDTWVAARRIWNEQSYHVTNVTEAGGIPAHEAESYRPLNGRLYNTYRSQPRSFGVAPDLVVTGISVSAVDGGCAIERIGEFETPSGNMALISIEVRNEGDLRVGPGVVVSLEGDWTQEKLREALHADSSGTALTALITDSLEPGASVILSVAYDVTLNTPGRVPDVIIAQVDAADAERECDESNNVREYTPAAEGQQTDLRLTIEAVSGCPDATVVAGISNDGAAFAGDMTITWYAGNPSQGGMKLSQSVVTGGVGSGESVPVEAGLPDFPTRGDITVFGVLAADVSDCNAGNNTARAGQPHTCTVVLE